MACAAPDGNHWTLTRDGSTVVVRELGPRDREQLVRLHEDMPAEDRYLRFFSAASASYRDYVDSVTRERSRDRVALGAFHAGALLGMASYTRASGRPEAEFAVVVARSGQSGGVGTALLEHLVAVARSRGIAVLTAQVLAANTQMLRVIADLGLPCSYRRDHEVVDVTMRLDGVLATGQHEYLAGYQAAIDNRDRIADVAALRPLLEPASVVVVGASHTVRSVGNSVVRNLLGSGFAGSIAVVNPHVDQVLGVPSYPSVTDLPHTPQLAVICVPAESVLPVVRDCGRRGVRALVVISAGLSADPDLANLIHAEVRAHDMRMVGPNCLGVLNTDLAVRLNATFADRPARSGTVGVITQSGGVANALLHELDRIGCGVSAMVSTGDKYDVNSSDILHWFRADRRTAAVVVYLESFGEPRKFARLSREMALSVPIVAIRAAMSSAGSKAAGSHTAALATPAVTADALYRQAGILPVDSIRAAVSLLALLTCQPLPTTGRLAVVSNAGGAGVLAADACARHGLAMAKPTEQTRRRLSVLLPKGAVVTGPVDTTATVDGAAFGTAISHVLEDPGVAAVLAVTVPTALGDPVTGVDRVAGAARSAGKALIAVQLGQPTAVLRREVSTVDGLLTVPSYADVSDAVQAVAHAVRRAEWLARDHDLPPDPVGFDRTAISKLVHDFLDGHPSGGWLDPQDSLVLLAHAGVVVRHGVVVPTRGDPEPVVAAAAAFEDPVALKVVAEGVLHKTTAGGLALDQAGELEISETVARFSARFGDRLHAVFVQPMAKPGAELLTGVRGDPRFGPLLVFGVGGISADALDDRAALLCPATAADIAAMVRRSRYANALFDSDPPQANERAVVDLLRRVARLAEVTAQIAELDVNPVIATADGCLVVDARVRLEPAEDLGTTLRDLH